MNKLTFTPYQCGDCAYYNHSNNTCKLNNQQVTVKDKPCRNFYSTIYTCSRCGAQIYHRDIIIIPDEKENENKITCGQCAQ